ncbi:MAG: class I SAM-dependent rRNA methyltransferase [Candidatus Gracilibacteria bacterium]
MANSETKIFLKEKREVPVQKGHPWVFSNAIARVDSAPQNPAQASPIVEVYSSKQEFLGLATWNKRNSISLRIISRDKNQKIDTSFFAKRFAELLELKTRFLPDKTNGFRIVHSDADYMPGLIVDKYDSVIVFQIHTEGMEFFRNEIIEALEKVFKPKAIIERSDVEARKQENLKPLPPKVHKGASSSPIEFEENGIKFYADPINGQKTGFFLDQRDARIKTMQIAKGKKVLNLFGYTGAFSIYALKGGAEKTVTVDVSEKAIDLAEKNMKLNKISPKKSELICKDVFDYLNTMEGPGGEKKDQFDLIICDPPAFAKTANDVQNAFKAYVGLNKRCMDLLDLGGLLVTSSCSGRVTLDDFLTMLKIAAGQANKDFRILDTIEQPSDHTSKISFPEGRYLKTLVLECINKF